MIKKLLVPSFLVFAALIIFPALSSHAASIAGAWKEPSGVRIHFNQVGNSVTGTYTGGAGHAGLTGTISGTLHGHKFVGHYENREGNISGKGTIELTLKHHHQLEGRWQGITFPNQSGYWVLTRE